MMPYDAFGYITKLNGKPLTKTPPYAYYLRKKTFSLALLSYHHCQDDRTHRNVKKQNYDGKRVYLPLTSLSGFMVNPNPHGLLNDLFPTNGRGADSARALGTIVDRLPFLPNCA